MSGGYCFVFGYDHRVQDNFTFDTSASLYDTVSQHTSCANFNIISQRDIRTDLRSLPHIDA